jgi:hypothetical protein
MHLPDSFLLFNSDPDRPEDALGSFLCDKFLVFLNFLGDLCDLCRDRDAVHFP